MGRFLHFSINNLVKFINKVTLVYGSAKGVFYFNIKPGVSAFQISSMTLDMQLTVMKIKCMHTNRHQTNIKCMH